MYCIDTSALIHAWRRDYPPDVFRSVWDHLDQLVDAGRVFSSIEVLLELERGSDDIFKWAKDRKHMFLEIDKEGERTLRNIVDNFPSFVPQDSHSGIWADGYVIAIAATKKWTVVTGEKKVGPGAKRIKIPNVCQLIGIQCIEFLQLIRNENWVF